MDFLTYARDLRKQAEGIMREFDCRYCGAPAGTSCVSASGRRQNSHADRFYQAKHEGRLPLPRHDDPLGLIQHPGSLR